MALPNPLATDRPFTINQIKAYVPVTLDMEKLNYEVWRELFETHCSSFGVLCHIDGTSTAPTPSDKTWQERNNLVKMWMYGTISESILETVLKPKCSARDLWCSIENLFRDNKEARALQLENELRTTVIGDLTVHEYCKKLKCIADLLANIDSPVSERVLVMHILNGLSDKFDSILNVIKHKSPFPSFLETRSMLQSEEERLKKQVKTATPDTHSSSSPTVLYTSTNAPSADNSSRHQQQPTTYHQHNSGGNYRGRGRGRGGRGYRGRGGRFYNNNNGYWPSHYNQSPWPSYQHTGYGTTPMMQPGLLGPPPRPAYEAHMVAPHNLLPTQITHAFNTMALNDPNDTTWYMDSGATNHIASGSGSQHQNQTTPM